MNRRSFLKRLGVGSAAVAAVAVVPELATSLFEGAPPAVATIGEYCNYANFSQLAIATSVDEAVTNASLELGHRSVLAMNTLWEATYDGATQVSA
jgi:hypothetical protein